MGVEIERRFLVTDPGWRSLAGPAQPLRQGYLAASPEGVTVRIRLKAAEKAWLTLKAPADSRGDLVVVLERPPIPLGWSGMNSSTPFPWRMPRRFGAWRRSGWRKPVSISPCLEVIGWWIVLPGAMHRWFWPKWNCPPPKHLSRSRHGAVWRSQEMGDGPMRCWRASRCRAGRSISAAPSDTADQKPGISY